MLQLNASQRAIGNAGGAGAPPSACQERSSPVARPNAEVLSSSVQARPGRPRRAWQGRAAGRLSSCSARADGSEKNSSAFSIEVVYTMVSRTRFLCSACEHSPLHSCRDYCIITRIRWYPRYRYRGTMYMIYTTMYGPQWTVYEPGLDYFVDREREAIWWWGGGERERG